jgi:hypothetical protein
LSVTLVEENALRLFVASLWGSVGAGRRRGSKYEVLKKLHNEALYRLY